MHIPAQPIWLNDAEQGVLPSTIPAVSAPAGPDSDSAHNGCGTVPDKMGGSKALSEAMYARSCCIAQGYGLGDAAPHIHKSHQHSTTVVVQFHPRNLSGLVPTTKKHPHRKNFAFCRRVHFFQCCGTLTRNRCTLWYCDYWRASLWAMAHRF